MPIIPALLRPADLGFVPFFTVLTSAHQHGISYADSINSQHTLPRAAMSVSDRESRAKRDATPRKGWSIVWLLFTGFGIGWLIGLSVSPVVSIVITSVTTAAAAIIAALSGLENTSSGLVGLDGQKTPMSRWSVDPLPLMLLVLGIVGGSLLGIKARNDSWLGSPVSIEVKRWTDAGLLDAGVTQKDLILRLFESQHYTGTATLTAKPGQVNPLGTFLFGVSTSECENLTAASAKWFAISDPEPLQIALQGSTTPRLRQLPVIIKDAQTLAEVVDNVLCAGGSSQP